MTDDLVAWIREQIDDDERVANAATSGPWFEAKRKILAEVMSWGHFYLDEDGWYSCSQAVDPSDTAAEPGSGCIDGDRAGKPCDCGLDRRRGAILGPLAAGYADRDGYKAEWGQR